MSIPKEPRQLMINLMYLVLTALLALNVSAEVMNAFFTLDAGNTETIKVVDGQLDATVKSLNTLLEDDSKAKYRPIQPAITQVRQEVSAFNAYIDGIRTELIDQSGNRDGELNAGDFKAEHDGELKYIRGKKNKDVTTRLLVEGETGKEIKAKITQTRQSLIDAYRTLLTENQKDFGLSDEEVASKVASVGSQMPFNVDDEAWKESDKNSWEEYKFKQMPVAAVLPLLSQMKADLKSAEANMVNSMASLAGGKTVEFDSFFPVVAADRSYVVGGETINATVSVGTYSSALDPANVRITADGRSLRLNSEGKAELKIPASGSGQKTVKLDVAVTNPLTGEVTRGKNEFTYEVGSRSAAVSADMMNVFYIGVPNPVTVSAAGVSSNDVRVNFSGPISGSGSGGKYVVKANGPGEAKVTVSANGQTLTSADFRVKRIPDPVAKLGNKLDGTMGNGEFKAQRGVIAWLENFDFDAKCNIQGFELVRVPKRQDPITVINRGGTYSGDAKRIVGQAKPGDKYFFSNVKARCPGDSAGRKINSMVFQIK